MRVPVKLHVAALGLVLECEAEIPDNLIRPPEPNPVLDNPALCERWRCSARTLARLRNQGKLPYAQPTPRRYLYALEHVEAVERQTSRSAIRAVPNRAAGRSGK